MLLDKFYMYSKNSNFNMHSNLEVQEYQKWQVL